jgi:hypothetical protein
MADALRAQLVPSDLVGSYFNCLGTEHAASFCPNPSHCLRWHMEWGSKLRPESSPAGLGSCTSLSLLLIIDYSYVPGSNSILGPSLQQSRPWYAPLPPYENHTNLSLVAYGASIFKQQLLYFRYVKHYSVLHSILKSILEAKQGS